MTNKRPSRKVTLSALSGAITILLVSLIEYSLSTTVPATVSSALTTVVSFITGYYVPDAEDEV